MASRCCVAALVALALGGVCRSDVDLASLSQPNLRGFGRVAVEYASGGSVAVMRFTCETAEKAVTVAGKFLMDIYDEPDVAFKDGIHETKGAQRSQ